VVKWEVVRGETFVVVGCETSRLKDAPRAPHRIRGELELELGSNRV